MTILEHTNLKKMLEPEEEARVELVYYIWKRLNNYLLNMLPKVTQNIGIDLEQKMASWVMDYRRTQKSNILCIRTGDTPIAGVSGIYHKIDNLMYIIQKNYALGNLIECKNLEIESLKKNYLTLGDFPRIGRRTIALIVFKGFDVCPQSLFRKHFYINTKRNFCMLITTKPLDYSALALALSYGVCVVQPDRTAYQNFIKKIEPETVVLDEIIKKIPIYYPPEVLLRELSASEKASKRNVSLSFEIYRHLFSKNLEKITSNFAQLTSTFHENLAENKNIFEKVSYLSMYFKSLSEAV